jgi:hypothetical protein
MLATLAAASLVSAQGPRPPSEREQQHGWTDSGTLSGARSDPRLCFEARVPLVPAAQ